MKIRRFFAVDMRQALKQVSEELGPDAAIMSTRKTKGGVEVVAATDYEAALHQHSNKILAQKKRSLTSDKTSIDVPTPIDAPIDAPIEEPIDVITDKPDAKIDWFQEPNLVAIKEEVHLMRELLQDQLGELTWSDRNRRMPIQAAILRKMVKMGFPPTLANSFAQTINPAADFESAWSQLINKLSSTMTKGEHNILRNGGIVSLVGSTGVGKTTTIAKLAARYVLQHGPETVALVTTDSYRVAAHEQLRAYANIMGVSMRVAHDGNSLSTILDELSDKKLILIDNAGISQRDKRLAEQISCLMNTGKSINSYLVLSTTAQIQVLKETVKTFGLLPLAGTILTKLDEAVSLGESLGVVISEQLNISYITDGQRVPEDLHSADSAQLINKAINLGQVDAEDWVTAMALNQG